MKDRFWTLFYKVARSLGLWKLYYYHENNGLCVIEPKWFWERKSPGAVALEDL